MEFTKCAGDFLYFCEKYVKITHPMKGLMPFVLYEFQKRVVEDFEKYQYNIVKKFRQAGLTLLASVWAFWRCLFKLDQRIMIVSKTDREAIAVGKTVQNVKEYLPHWLKPDMRSESDHEKEFTDTGSVLWFYPANAARSKSLTYLVIDEAAFIPNMNEAWKSLYPTISTGGNCIAISTVFGIGNWYAETYMRAEDKKNQFHVINLNYKEHPDYNTPEWERKTRANLGERGWAQEILGNFFGSGDTYINEKVIAELSEATIDPVEKLFPEYDATPLDDLTEEELANENYVKGAMWIWKDPEPGHEYIVSADASEGVGFDFSAFHVIDIHTFEQVAEFYSDCVPVHKFSQVLAQVGTFYNEALVALDHDNGPGMAVANRLSHTIHYPNIFYDTGKTERPGLKVTRAVRPIMFETMQTCFSNRLVRVRSKRLIRELNTFIYNKGKGRPEASRGEHDDLVFSIAMALHIMDVAHRDVPVGVDIAPNRISKALIGKSFEEVRRHITEGLPEDFFAEEEKEVDYLLPKIMFGDDGPRRANDRFLRELGL